MMRRTNPMVSKGNNKMYIYIAIAVLVLVAIGVTLWLTLGNGSNDDKEEAFELGPSNRFHEFYPRRCTEIDANNITNEVIRNGFTEFRCVGRRREGCQHIADNLTLLSANSGWQRDSQCLVGTCDDMNIIDLRHIFRHAGFLNNCRNGNNAPSWAKGRDADQWELSTDNITLLGGRNNDRTNCRVQLRFVNRRTRDTKDVIIRTTSSVRTGNRDRQNGQSVWTIL
jgi:nitrogen fixation-related uncharacterized protein